MLGIYEDIERHNINAATTALNVLESIQRSNEQAEIIGEHIRQQQQAIEISIAESNRMMIQNQIDLMNLMM